MHDKWLSWQFIALIIAVFIVFYGVIFFADAYSYSVGTSTSATQTYQSIVAIRNSSSGLSVFENNFFASLPLIVPVLGLLIFGNTMYNTGYTIGLLALATGYTPLSYLLGISFPVVWLELLSYSILGAETTYVSLLFITRHNAVERLKHQSWKSLLLYLVLLVSIAYVEVAMFA